MESLANFYILDIDECSEDELNKLKNELYKITVMLKVKPPFYLLKLTAISKPCWSLTLSRLKKVKP